QASILSPEQLKEISELLGQTKGEIIGRLVELREVGLIDLKALKLAEKLGQYNSSELVAFLKENAENIPVSEILSLWVQGQPGKGGITRGRGDAAMTWSDGTSEEGTKFKEQVLPPGSVAALKDNQLIGLSAGTPSVEPVEGPSKSGALNGASAGGGSAFTQVILPRHRGAVKRYFERN
ncbi:MAG: hypothetical protein L0Y56_13420, partial [Nitrospira sp.]|nr:hypothetical protein [Nitrospira sp.]